MGTQGKTNGLSSHGVINSGTVNWNLGAEALYEATIQKGLGVMTKGGALAVETGKFTGRSPHDKFIVEEETSKGNIWWGNVNKGTNEAVFEAMHKQMTAYYQHRELYVQDLYAGADPTYRLNVRVVSDLSLIHISEPTRPY